MLDDLHVPGRERGQPASASRSRGSWPAGMSCRTAGPRSHPHVHDDCDERSGGHSGCIEPYCRCDGWVPLAVLTRREGGPIHISDLLAGRLPAAGYLTKISRINWPHGGELELDELVERRGRLEVDFDRPLLEADGDARGINQFTFRVQYGGLERNLEFMPSDGGQPRSGGPDQGRLHDRPRALGPGATGRRAGGGRGGPACRASSWSSPCCATSSSTATATRSTVIICVAACPAGTGRPAASSVAGSRCPDLVKGSVMTARYLTTSGSAAASSQPGGCGCGQPPGGCGQGNPPAAAAAANATPAASAARTSTAAWCSPTTSSTIWPSGSGAARPCTATSRAGA